MSDVESLLIHSVGVHMLSLVPPIMLAAFAMQESSCNPDETGGGGEQGLMQITSDKCGDAPNGNCKDPVCELPFTLNFCYQLTVHHAGL